MYCQSIRSKLQHARIKMSAALSVLQVTNITCTHTQWLTVNKDDLQCRSRQGRKDTLSVSR